MKRLYIFLPALILFYAPITFAASASDVNAAQKTADKQSNLTITVGDYTEQIPQEKIESWVHYKSTYALSLSSLNEFENNNYCPINKILCSLTLTEMQKRHIRLTNMAVVDNEAIDSYIQSLSKKVNRDPSDAKFSVVDGRVTTFSEAQDGITLDIEKSEQALQEALKSDYNKEQMIALPFESKKATSNYGDVNNIGISSLLGEGVSDFKGSPVNRVKNIKVAINRFNGLLIKPGEEFSFTKILGDVDAEHGYFPELVIKNKITEPDFGGGVCQVSTTMFRAAIYSGLKITARRNHAYPVSYYNPQGMDSTVYVPNPDLRFINNTPSYILVQVKIIGTKLYFDFYGTDDGRKTSIDGPRVTEKQPDGALKTTFVQHVVDKNGTEFINDVFNSAYQSPYKFPHPGGPVLSAKPSNWSDDEWKNYQQTLKDIAKAQKNTKR